MMYSQRMLLCWYLEFAYVFDVDKLNGRRVCCGGNAQEN